MVKTIQITVNLKTLKSDIKQHLSIIGKRQGDKQGNTLFVGVTLSSTEENIIEQYMKAAVETFVGELSPKVKFYASTESTIKVTIDTNRINSGCKNAFEGNLRGYVTSYVVNATIGMNYPELAKKYNAEMEWHMNAAVNLIFTKEQHFIFGKTLKDMKGEVIL